MTLVSALLLIVALTSTTFAYELGTTKRRWSRAAVPSWQMFVTVLVYTLLTYISPIFHLASWYTRAITFLFISFIFLLDLEVNVKLGQAHRRCWFMASAMFMCVSLSNHAFPVLASLLFAFCLTAPDIGRFIWRKLSERSDTTPITSKQT